MTWPLYGAGVTTRMILSLDMADRRVAIVVVGVSLHCHSASLQ